MTKFAADVLRRLDLLRPKSVSVELLFTGSPFGIEGVDGGPFEVLIVFLLLLAGSASSGAASAVSQFLACDRAPLVRDTILPT